MYMAEIEKKFRLVELPPKSVAAKGTRIVQAYLFVDEGELRIRHMGDDYYITVKGVGSVERAEWEEPIPAWAFEFLYPKARDRVIEKTRYSVPHGRFTLEIDEYGGRHGGLVTMECEFPDRKSIADFVLPAWALGSVDVTEDKRYKNKWLATHGLPIPWHGDKSPAED
jgi:adenylate cyclase